jgi:hypothetical protein
MGQYTIGVEGYGCDVVGTATGATAIFTAPQPFVVFAIQAVTIGVTGLILGPSISIGTNSSSYNNVLSISLLTSLTALNNAFNLNTSNPGYVIQTNEVVYIKVTTAALATTYDFQINLIGYPT